MLVMHEKYTTDHVSENRRGISTGAGGSLAAMTLRRVGAQGAFPAAGPGLSRDASPVAGAWSYTDVFGNTVTVPKSLKRIAANPILAAAL